MLDAKPFTSTSTDHGIKYEPLALQEYEKYMHKIGHPIKVERSGFFVSPKLHLAFHFSTVYYYPSGGIFFFELLWYVFVYHFSSGPHGYYP